MNLALMAEELLVLAGYTVIKAARVPTALKLIGLNRVDAALRSGRRLLESQSPWLPKLESIPVRF